MENGQSNVSGDLAMGNGLNSVLGHRADCKVCDMDSSPKTRKISLPVYALGLVMSMRKF